MELRKTLSRLQPDHSLEASLFRAWLKNEATMDEWTTGVAVSESGRSVSVRPRVYAPMPQALRSYCTNRSEGRMDYDYSIAKKLGEWFDGIQSAWEFNLERLEHYSWAADRTKGSGTVDAHILLMEACERFYRVKFPEDDVRLCLHAKKLDSEARIRMSRGA